MKKFLLGTKVGMTQLFDDTGAVHPSTIIKVSPLTVTDIKTTERDGYAAVQVGYGSQKEHRINAAQRSKGTFSGFKEFRVENPSAYEVGASIDASAFSAGDGVQVSGVSKGKGFQGVVKRHGFAGGPRSHGQKHSEREPGSIGGGPGRAGGRVVRGMRMAGRMGSDRVTVKNLTVLKVDAAKGEVLVSGAIPGRKGSLIELIQN